MHLKVKVFVCKKFNSLEDRDSENQYIRMST